MNKNDLERYKKIEEAATKLLDGIHTTELSYEGYPCLVNYLSYKDIKRLQKCLKKKKHNG